MCQPFLQEQPDPGNSGDAVLISGGRSWTWPCQASSVSRTRILKAKNSSDPIYVVYLYHQLQSSLLQNSQPWYDLVALLG